ncbi:unnamed protein product [Prunus armeniaca]
MALLDELDSYHEPIICNCEGSEARASIEEKEKVMQFLMGLNEPYSTVHGSLLMMSPIPDTRCVHGLILQHERQMDVANCQIGSHAMQTGRYTTTKGNTSSGNLAVAKPPGAGDGKHDFYSRRSLKCSYCDGDTHTVENCYYLNGFPVCHKLHGKNIKPKNKRHAAYTTEKDPIPEHDSKSKESPTFTIEEYNQLIILLNNRPGNFPLANATGIVTSTCNLSQHDPHSNIYWIMDSGASYHISCFAPTHNTINTQHDFIGLPNGGKAEIKNIGSIKLSEALTLDGVLHVPQFNDVNTGRTIGLGKHFNGLYYLKATQNPHLAHHVHHTSHLWHQRLGHPSNAPTQALRFQANIPLRFWGESLQTACYLINRLPTPLLKHKSPYELLHNKSTNLLPKHKFDARACRCVFFGYPLGQKGYRLYDLSTQKFLSSRDVVFHENIFPFSTSPSENQDDIIVLPTPSLDLLSLPKAHLDNNPHPSHDPQTQVTPDLTISDSPTPSPHPSSVALDDASPSSLDIPALSQPITPHLPTIPSSPSIDTHPPPIRKSTHPTKPPSHFKDYQAHHTALLALGAPSLITSGTRYPITRYVSYSNFSEHHRIFVNNISQLVEPNTYEEARHNPHWVGAMNSEITALEENTWSLVPLPAGHRPIGCKWVFKIKYNSDNSIERYKAHLVAKGFTQREGINYTETFALVAKLITINCLLTIAYVRNWPLHQMDVHNAFLHGDLHEEVYMLPSSGYRRQGKHTMCRLHKSLYDYSMFTQTRGKSFTVILLYVDDMIITGNDDDAIRDLKHFLGTCFKIKDLGPLKYFLGVEIARSKSGISFLSTEVYTRYLGRCRLTWC